MVNVHSGGGDPERLFYRAVLERGCQSVSQVSFRTGLDTATLEQALKSLLAQGLVHRVNRDQHDRLAELVSYEACCRPRKAAPEVEAGRDGAPPRDEGRPYEQRAK